MTAGSWIVVENSSTIRPNTIFTKLKEGTGEGLTLEQARKFASQCTRDKAGGRTLYAEDYNNWGCCLAWVDDLDGAADQFAAGLEAKHREAGRKLETERILMKNLARCRPSLPTLRELKRTLEQLDRQDVAEMLQRTLDDERRLVE